MSVIEELNNKMPKWMNTTSIEYKAIWGQTQFNPIYPIEKSHDYQCGAIANELEYLVGYMDYISKSNDPEQFFGEYLEYIFRTLSGLHRFGEESDASVRNRLYSLFRRRMNPVWATYWCILDVLSYFFPRDELYLLENYVESNLIQNGDFESELGSEWTISQEGTTVVNRSSVDPFQESYSLEWLVDQNGSVSTANQIVQGLSSGIYTLSLFLCSQTAGQGIDVMVRRAVDGKYFDFNSMSWVPDEAKRTILSNQSYEYKNLCFSIDVTSDISLSIANTISPGAVLKVDMVELGERKQYPSFKILARSLGGQGREYLNLHYSTIDPQGGTDYNRMGYFDRDHIGGTFTGITTQYLQEILDIIKPAGVRAVFDVISVRTI